MIYVAEEPVKTKSLRFFKSVFSKLEDSKKCITLSRSIDMYSGRDLITVIAIDAEGALIEDLTRVSGSRVVDIKFLSSNELAILKWELTCSLQEKSGYIINSTVTNDVRQFFAMRESEIAGRFPTFEKTIFYLINRLK
jgi:hypothetical protein